MGRSQGQSERRIMAYRLKVSSRATREIGEAREWYENQLSGLGEEFINTLEIRLTQLPLSPLSHKEILPGIRRFLLPRFPYAVFYTVQADLVHILAVLHERRTPKAWPKSNP